jgi:hypothetical protein
VLDNSVQTQYVATSLTSGLTYEFKVEARNQVGYSGFSQIITLLCADIPSIPT